MPKSFLVRKKPNVQTRSWKDVATPTSIPTPEVKDDPTPQGTAQAEGPEEDSSHPEPPEDRQDIDTPPPKRQCKSERKKTSNSHNTLQTDVFHFPPPSFHHHNHHDHYSVPYRNHHMTEVFRRDCPDFPPFPHVPLLPPFPSPVMWNSVLHTHMQSPPFLHVHSPPQWLPTPPPTSSPLPNPWMTPPVVKVPSPVGVLSPAEVPSPSSLAVAEEPSSCNSAAIPRIPANKIDFSRHSDQSKALLPVPAPCYPIREHIPSYAKPTGVKVEVINNGFGIKNPLLSNEAPRTQEVIRPPSGYLMTSDTSHCNLCGFKTDSPRLLQKHLRSHKEIKRFLCTVCCKGFNDTFDLKRHTRTHTGVRPYKCLKCGKAFTQRCSLESHCKKIHGVKFQFAFNERRNKTYVCEECGHSTNDPEEHFVHLRTQHPNNPAILRCHDRRQFKFSRRKGTSLELEEICVS